MAIIKTHGITLYGGNDQDIVLRPLNDSHLPLLYRWHADSEVLYWTEGGEDIERSYDADTVRHIFGSISQNSFCFLIEVDGVSIGECWLQKMNLPDVMRMYPPETDVRRIDMAIWEKAYWGKGIGTQFIGMLVDFAFCGEHIDVLHCLCEDYNLRSCRVWLKHSFVLAHSDKLAPTQKGALQHHFVLTREAFIARRRVHVPQKERLSMPLGQLQPTQLYISAGKLRLVREWFDPTDAATMDPLPIKRLDGRIILTDGHTRAVAAHMAGWKTVPVYWDEAALDMRAYAMDVLWCQEAGLLCPADLAGRVVPHAAYETLWRKRCMEMILD